MAILTVGSKTVFGDYTVYIHNVSFSEFLEFATEDISCELLNGVLVIHSPASYTHESIFRFLITFIDQFGLQHNIGRAIGSRYPIKLEEDWAPEPDILFIRDEKKKNLKKNYLEGPADLIIEILSPSTRNDDLKLKLPKYIDSGVPEVWIVDPDKKKVTVHTKKGRTENYNTKKPLITSYVLVGLKIQIDWLWDDSVNPIECLKSLNQPDK